MTPNEHYVLITGATSGIGYELTKLFAKDGYNLILVARTGDDLDRTEKKVRENYQVNVLTLSKDLFDPKAPFEIYDWVQSQGVQVHILVNNAGQGEYGEFVDTDIQRERSIIQLNITSLVALTKLFLRDMVQRGEGRILNLASIASKLPGPLQAVYHGTKAFVHSFTESIREEVKETGVTITSLLPGATDTDFFRKAHMEDAKNVKEGKLADPAEAAKDGYEALMKGEDMVISGFYNKMQVAMSNLMPDDKVAAQVHKQQAPSNE